MVAIIYAIVSNNKGKVQYGKIDTASSKITDSLSEFSKKSEELTQGLSDVLDRLSEVRSISIETREQVSRMNSDEFRNPKDSQSNIAQNLPQSSTNPNNANDEKPESAEHDDEEIIEKINKASQDTIDRVAFNFINAGSFIGNLALLACIYSRDTNKPFNASDIFPPSNQDYEMYIFGYIIASSALGVIYAQNINGRFQVINYYPLIKLILEKNIQEYLARPNDPSQAFNKETYEFMLRYFGLLTK